MTSLSPRDHEVIDAVDTLRQIWTSQLLRLCFSEEGTSPLSRGQRTRRALARLRSGGHVGRIERFIGSGGGGSEGYVYIPSNSRTDTIDRHSLDRAELYVRLVEAERQGLCRVIEFTPEETVKGTKVVSDAYLLIEVGGQEYEWYIEVDRGKEYRTQLRTKMRAYTRAAKASSDGYFPRVLYVVSWAVRDRLAERVRLIRDVAGEQEFPEQYEACTLDETLSLLLG